MARTQARTLIGPPQSWVRSVEELSRLQPAELREWLRYGVKLWTSEAPASERLAAFAPLVLNPREPGPRQFSRAVRDMLHEFPRTAFGRDLEECLADELAIWSYTDGVQPGAFLLEFAGWFGCLHLEPALRSMMSRPIHLVRGARDALARAMGFAISRRLGANRTIVLARRMIECGLNCQPVLVQLLADVAAAYPDRLFELLDTFLPDWDVTDFTLPSNRLLAHQLVDKVGFETIVRVVFEEATSQLANVSLLLRTHRLEAKQRAEGGIEVNDKEGPSSIVLPRASLPARFDQFTNQRFRESAIGDLDISDEELLAFADEAV